MHHLNGWVLSGQSKFYVLKNDPGLFSNLKYRLIGRTKYDGFLCLQREETNQTFSCKRYINFLSLILCVCKLSRIMTKPCVNNKEADQHVHLRSTVSIFVVHCLDSIMPSVAISEICRLWLATAELAGLSLAWSLTSKNRFSHDVAHIIRNLSTLCKQTPRFAVSDLGLHCWPIMGS